MGHSHIFSTGIAHTGFFESTSEPLRDIWLLWSYAKPADRELMQKWKIRDPQWWRVNMEYGQETIRFVDGWVRVGERFLLRESLGEDTFTYTEAIRRIEGFAPISKYLDCFRLMPSGNLLEGNIKKWYLQGEAIRELWRLIGVSTSDYWSSTPCGTHEELAWSVNFQLGYAANQKKTAKYAMGYVI